MTFRDIAIKVGETVQDSSLTGDAHLIQLFDRCVKQLAQRIDFSALIAEATVTVDVSESDTTADLPSDFLRNILYAYDEDSGAEIEVVTPHRMWDLYPKMDGEGEAVAYLAVRDNTIHVQPAPSDDVDIVIRYIAAPDEVDSLSDTVPEWIPASEQFDLFYHFACERLYALLEDGADGAKPNTAYHAAMFKQKFNSVAWLERSNGSEVYPGDFEA